ncbi:protein NRT1/ PTR FAMILY 5.10-like [Henckelia pumila]|uniref:protein NRT1/ PTR FAMILY 5.10-like n=1 Tax=Henckelia pumila TaxID=405737 RepID=UPI003C6DC303
MDTGNDIPGPQTPLLNDVVSGCVDFKRRPSVRSKSGCWNSASFIIGVEMAERFAYYGISSNLVTYLTGPLGQPTATAVANVNAWSGTAALSPLVGAFIADSFLGRYRTIIIASVLYILGLGFLCLSAALNSVNSSEIKNDVDSLAYSPLPPYLQIFFFFSLYLVALAQGGHKPSLQAFGADQFDEEHQKESKAKASFFNWWNFALCLSVLASLLLLNYIQENMSWELGFGIPSIVMCFALFVFLFGTVNYRYRISSDESNPFARISSVFVKTAINWQATLSDPSTDGEARPILHHEDSQFRLLENALIIPEGSKNNTKGCSVADIEEAKAILRLVPLWSSCLGYAIAYTQPSTLFTKQGATMDRYITSSFQIPAASLQCLIAFSIFAFIPIYDLILVPITRAITKKPSGISTLQRIGIGILLSFVALVIAAFVERKRLATAIEHGLADLPKATVPMSIWWLAPQYVVFGIADAFTYVGLQEFFYDQVSTYMKSVGIALCLGLIGIGNFLSSFLVSAIEKITSKQGDDGWFSDNLNRAHLDYFYWVLAGISAFAFSAYVYFARSYVYHRRVTA